MSKFKYGHGFLTWREQQLITQLEAENKHLIKDDNLQQYTVTDQFGDELLVSSDVEECFSALS